MYHSAKAPQRRNKMAGISKIAECNAKAPIGALQRLRKFRYTSALSFPVWVAALARWVFAASHVCVNPQIKA